MISILQLFGVMNIVNSEPITIGHSEVNCSEGNTIDDGFQLREKLEYIFFTAVLFVYHPIGDRPVVTRHVIPHCVALLVGLP